MQFYATHKYDRPQDFADERFENGLFRCERCTALWPLPIRLQDGFRLCQRCWDPLSPNEARDSMAKQRAANASAPIDYLEYPVTSATSGAIAVTGVSPLTLNLTRGGASDTIAITGINLSTADTWSSSSPSHITVTPAVNSTTSVTLTISADGTTTRGDYDITFNGDTITPRKILRIR